MNDNHALNRILLRPVNWRASLPPARKDYKPLAASLLIHALVFGSVLYASFGHKPEPQPQIIEVSLISMAAPENMPVPTAEAMPIKAQPAPRIEPKHAEQKPKPEPVKQTAKSDVALQRAPEKQEQKKEQKETETAESASKPSAATSLAGTGETGKDHSTVIPVMTDAQYRHQSPPDYPKRAREMGQQGKVILQALVDPSGTPKEIKIIKSSGFSLLDSAAEEAVRKWEFEPMRQDGKIVLSWVQVPVQFLIN